MLVLSPGLSQEEKCGGAIPVKLSRSRCVLEIRLRRKQTYCTIRCNTFLLQSTAAAPRKQTSAAQDFSSPPPQENIFNSLKQLSVHKIHASSNHWKDNANKSCTVIITSTTNYTQDILLLVQCHLLLQEENQWLSWAYMNYADLCHAGITAYST